MTGPALARLGSVCFPSGFAMPKVPAVMKILLVEDDLALRDALSDVLADQGYSIDCASNGQEALDHLEHGLPPDLILLDLVMPVMDGWAFRDAQRRSPRLAAIPTLVLSASYPPDSPRMRSLGAQAVLSKPIGMERLIGAVARFLPVSPFGMAH
jgi:CheY-like chemotaxis protein